MHIAKTGPFKIAAAEDLVDALNVGESSHSCHWQYLFHLHAGHVTMQESAIFIYFFLENVYWKQPVEHAGHLFGVYLLLFLKAAQKWRKVPSTWESNMSLWSPDCCSLMSMVDGVSFQSKLLKTSGQAFSLMQLKFSSRWRWHGNL